jgi:transketolase
VEAGSSTPWYRYAGRDGKVVGLDRFGESAPAKVLFQSLGFSVERVVETLNQVL